jgi:glycosyltransferase involved in cell wall biosynthesis
MEEKLTAVMPLVTIGMPVRNGDPYIEDALANILEQDYPNLEIIISDNCSTDSTPAILKRVQSTDPRIRIFRQDELLTAVEHFEWVMNQARGCYFMWAAHDDLRSSNYITSLVQHLEKRPNSVLAFGDLRVSSRFGKGYNSKLFPFETEGLAKLARARKAAHSQCYHIYGLWRTDVLRGIPFIFNGWWPDLPLMIAASTIGHFSRAHGVYFDYLEIKKTNVQRVQYQDNQSSYNRIGRTLRLFLVTFLTVQPVSGSKTAFISTLFVIEKQFRLAFGLLTGRIRRGE